jgi:hypothetical protein
MYFQFFKHQELILFIKFNFRQKRKVDDLQDLISS